MFCRPHKFLVDVPKMSKDGTHKSALHYLKGFVASSVSPALAALLTNPIEVVKVRQQIENAGACICQHNCCAKCDGHCVSTGPSDRSCGSLLFVVGLHNV